MPPRPGPERKGDRLLDELFAADSAAGVASAGARVLAEASGAPIAAVFLFDDEKPLVEAWHPADTGANRASAPLRALALERSSIVRGKRAPAGARVIPLESHGERVGAVVLGGATGVRARNASFRRIVSALACRAALEIQTLKGRSIHDRYERWFRTLDEQLHVLDRERQKFAAVVNQNDVFVFVADAGRAVRWVNRALAARYPVEAPGASWVGRTCHDLCSRLGEGACNGTCPVDRALADNRPAHGEYRQRGPDGDRVLYATGLPIKGPEGRPHEVLVMLQDLTEVETVRRLETRLHAVVASLPIVLFSTDRDGSFTLSEGRGLAALGLRPGQVVGQSAFEFYRGYPDIVENLRRALRGEEFTALVELGELRYETHYAPLRDPGGAITGMIGVATDLTSASRARRAA